MACLRNTERQCTTKTYLGLQSWLAHTSAPTALTISCFSGLTTNLTPRIFEIPSALEVHKPSRGKDYFLCIRCEGEIRSGTEAPATRSHAEKQTSENLLKTSIPLEEFTELAAQGRKAIQERMQLETLLSDLPGDLFEQL